MLRSSSARQDASGLEQREKGLAGGAGGGNERPCSLAWTASEICAGCLPRRTTWNSKNAKRSNTAAPEGGHFFRAQSRKKPRQLSLSLLFSCATFWVAGEARAITPEEIMSAAGLRSLSPGSSLPGEYRP